MNCPDCNSKMHRAGFAWSGRQKIQRWKCNQCGRTTIKDKPKKEGK